MSIATTEGSPPTELEEVIAGVDAPSWSSDAEQSAAQHDPIGHADRTTRYRIADEGQADWAMRKLVKISERARDVDAMAARQIEPIEHWRGSQQRELEREGLFWTGLLTEFHRGVVAEDPKATMVKLPHGQLRSRKASDSWDFDAETFIAWARAHAPEFIRTKEEVDKALAKKDLFVDDDKGVYLKVGDELIEVEGVHVAAGDRNFDVVIEGVSK